MAYLRQSISGSAGNSGFTSNLAMVRDCLERHHCMCRDLDAQLVNNGEKLHGDRHDLNAQLTGGPAPISVVRADGSTIRLSQRGRLSLWELGRRGAPHVAPRYPT